MSKSPEAPFYCLLIKNLWQKMSRYYNRRLSAYGIAVPQALLLLELTLDDGANPRELSARLHLDSSSMTGLLGRMERTGLIERRPDLRDRRGVKVFLTRAGIDLQQVVRRIVAGTDADIAQHLTVEEGRNFRRITRKITEGLLD